MVTKLEIIVESQALLGECPCWHQKQQLLSWVDGDNQQLHVYQPETKIDRTIEIGQLVGCVVPRKSGGVVLALETGFAALDLETEKLTPLANPESHPPSNRFND